MVGRAETEMIIDGLTEEDHERVSAIAARLDDERERTFLQEVGDVPHTDRARLEDVLEAWHRSAVIFASVDGPFEEFLDRADARAKGDEPLGLGEALEMHHRS